MLLHRDSDAGAGNISDDQYQRSSLVTNIAMKPAGAFLKTIFLAASLTFSVCPASVADEFVFAGRPNFLVGDIAVEVLDKAYRRLGHTFRVQLLPPKRALVEANSGQLDGDIARLIHVTKEYSNLKVVPVPVSAIQISAFTRDPKIRIDDWKDLKNHHSGVVIGFRYIESRLEGHSHTKTTSALSLYRMLRSGRVDIAIDSSLRGLKTLQENDINGVFLLRPPIETVAEYHLLHKSNEYLIPKLTTVLGDMKRNGEIDRIYEKFINRLRRN